MARKKPICNICGTPVEIDGNGFVDDGGQVWCDVCANEFYHRVGELIDKMREEKKNGTAN